MCDNSFKSSQILESISVNKKVIDTPSYSNPFFYFRPVGNKKTVENWLKKMECDKKLKKSEHLKKPCRFCFSRKCRLIIGIKK